VRDLDLRLQIYPDRLPVDGPEALNSVGWQCIGLDGGWQCMVCSQAALKVPAKCASDACHELDPTRCTNTRRTAAVKHRKPQTLGARSERPAARRCGRGRGRSCPFNHNSSRRELLRVSPLLFRPAPFAPSRRDHRPPAQPRQDTRSRPPPLRPHPSPPRTPRHPGDDMCSGVPVHHSPPPLSICHVVFVVC
jgi:hypothetical protein